MLNRDPWAIGLLYVNSLRFYTDLMCVAAFPLVTWSSPHFAPLQLVTLIYISECARMLERSLKASQSRRRMIELAIFSVFTMHWIACVWSLVADRKHAAYFRGWHEGDDKARQPVTWLQNYINSMESPPARSSGITYLYALYWTLATITTIGYGDVITANELEVAVMCVTICVSALLYSTLIAYMSNLILSSDVNWTTHKQKVETIKSYMRHRKIPSSLQLRVEEYLDYLWATQKGLDESNILAVLPDTLRQQLSLFCNSRIVSTVPLFSGVSSHVCAAIVMQLQPRVFVPDDLIVAKGDWGDCMFLIYRGVVKLVELSEQSGKNVYLRDGDYFGEIAVLTCGKRMVSVRAVTYCHLYSLGQKLLGAPSPPFPPTSAQRRWPWSRTEVPRRDCCRSSRALHSCSAPRAPIVHLPRGPHTFAMRL